MSPPHFSVPTDYYGSPVASGSSSSTPRQDLDYQHAECGPQAAGPSAPASAKKLKTCAPCRLRKVKCEREQGRRDCRQCEERGLECTAVAARKRVNRTGRLLEQARNGLASVRTEQTPDPMDGGDQLEVIAGSPWLESEHTVGRRLGTQELQAAVTGSLLDMYLASDMGVGRLMVAGTSLAHDFHRANRRVHELKPSSQVLCAVIMAIGARCSDHPALIGAGAPRIAELGKAARAGIDLRPFGRRREQACATLFSRALGLADRHGTLRDASVESMAALVLMEGLFETTDVQHSQARPFVNAYISHAKALLENGAPTPTGHQELTRVGNNNTNPVLSWTAYFRDALTAAEQGRAPAFSDDDYFLLTNSGRQVPAPLGTLLAQPPSPSQQAPDAAAVFWDLLQAIMHETAHLAREVPAHLTGPRARTAERIDEAFAGYFMREANALFDALPELRRRLEVAKASTADLYAMADVPAMVRGISVMTCTLSWLINRVVGQRLAGRHTDTTTILADRGPNAGALVSGRGHTMQPWPAMPGPINDEAYWHRLFLLRRETYARAFRASRTVAAIIGETIEQHYSLSSAWLDSRFIQVLFSCVPSWASIIVNMPTVEQGGPHADFSFMDKLQDLDWIRKGCFSVGWMDASMGNAAEWIIEEIGRTEQAQREYWDTRTATPAPTVEVQPPSPFPATRFAAYRGSLTPEQLGHTNLSPRPPLDSPLLGSMSGLSPAANPASSTLAGSTGASGPASPLAAQESSPSSGAGASPTGAGLPALDGLGQRMFSEAEVHALLAQYTQHSVPPPASAASPLLSMPTHIPQPQPPPPPSSLPTGSPTPAADSWHAFAQDAPVYLAAFDPATASHFTGVPSAGTPLEGVMAGVDWSALLSAGVDGFADAQAASDEQQRAGHDPFARLW